MYQTNGLWYARVGNSQTQIDTTESPSIRSTEYAAGTPTLLPLFRDPLSGDNTNVINMVLQDTDPLLSHGTPVEHTTPQVHSSAAWYESSSLLQQSDTCSESDSESKDSDNSLTQNIYVSNPINSHCHHNKTTSSKTSNPQTVKSQQKILHSWTLVQTKQ